MNRYQAVKTLDRIQESDLHEAITTELGVIKIAAGASAMREAEIEETGKKLPRRNDPLMSQEVTGEPPEITRLRKHMTSVSGLAKKNDGLPRTLLEEIDKSLRSKDKLPSLRSWEMALLIAAEILMLLAGKNPGEVTLLPDFAREEYSLLMDRKGRGLPLVLGRLLRKVSNSPPRMSDGTDVGAESFLWMATPLGRC